MGVKQSMNTFFSAMQGQNSSGYGGRLVNTPMGPFRWDDNFNMWINVNNGMALSNISFQDEFASMMDYNTLDSSGAITITATGVSYFIPNVSATLFDYTTISVGSYATLSRGSTYGSFVGSCGYITNPSGVTAPKFEYDSITGQLKGLLIEPASTNIIFATSINGIGWSNTSLAGGGNNVNKGDESITEASNITRSPSGIINTGSNDGVVILCGDGAGSSTAITSRTMTADTGSTYYNFSVWAKTGYTLSGLGFAGQNYIRLYAGDSTLTNYAYSSFNLITGTLETSGLSGSGYSMAESFIEGYTTGGTGYNWYRCSMTFQKPAADTALRSGFAAGITQTNALGYIFAWGPQCERVYNYTDALGNNVVPKRPSSFIRIPLNAGPATNRPADLFNISGASFTAFYNPYQSTISLTYTMVDPYYTKPYLVLGPTGSTSPNISIVDYVGGNIYTNYFGVSGASFNYTLTPAGLSSGTFTFVVGYCGASGAMAMNTYGVTGFTITGNTLPPVDQLSVTRLGTGGAFYLQNIRYWNTVVGNTAISGIAQGLTVGNTYTA
jgi:hypothetical protein